MRDPRSRHSSDERFDRSERDERGFFERAGDEISSWFGSDEERGRADPRDDERQRYDRRPAHADEGYRRPYTGSFSGRQRPSRDDDEYRPMTGDYGRSSSREREPRREAGFTGMAPTAAPAHDRHYDEWRRRQIDALDRDYDEYRRENQSRFESDFSSWRDTRQTKRQMLGTIREQMVVMGSDGEELGRVDKVRGDRVVLTKNDSPDGAHHSINCAMIDRVEGDRVILDKTAEEARRGWSNEDRDRALFERDEQREPGAHMLNRSFSGTY